MTTFGVVPYINALPLYRYLNVSVVKAVPSELYQRMNLQQLDYALMPVFGTFKNPHWHLLPKAGVIQSNGAVESVCLFVKKEIVHPSEVKTICYTTDSMSSKALSLVLRKFCWKKDSSLIEVTRDQADALLLIGDEALLFNNTNYTKWDLGEIWTNWTKLPFVFAMWVSAKAPDSTVIAELTQARDEGLKSLDQIIHEIKSPLSGEQLNHYFKKSLQFTAHPQISEALALFKEYCIALKLL